MDRWTKLKSLAPDGNVVGHVKKQVKIPTCMNELKGLTHTAKTLEEFKIINDILNGAKNINLFSDVLEKYDKSLKTVQMLVDIMGFSNDPENKDASDIRLIYEDASIDYNMHIIRKDSRLSVEIKFSLSYKLHKNIVIKSLKGLNTEYMIDTKQFIWFDLEKPIYQKESDEKYDYHIFFKDNWCIPKSNILFLITIKYDFDRTMEQIPIPDISCYRMEPMFPVMNDLSDLSSTINIDVLTTNKHRIIRLCKTTGNEIYCVNNYTFPL